METVRYGAQKVRGFGYQALQREKWTAPALKAIHVRRLVLSKQEIRSFA